MACGKGGKKGGAKKGGKKGGKGKGKPCCQYIINSNRTCEAS